MIPMIRETVHALAACVVTFVLCSVIYPAAVWGLGQLAFPQQAEGSLIYSRDRAVIGSELIAQPFTSDKYFHPRPSAADYKADAASGSNLGTKNPDLRAKVKERAEALKATPEAPAPADLISASGSGLDPDLSPEAAYYQVPRVAAARKMPIPQVRALIDRHVDRSGALLGAPPRVNVLRLNLALDEEKPAPAAAPAAAAPARPDPAGDVAALRTEIGHVSDQLKHMVERLEERSEAIDRGKAAQGDARAELTRLGEQVARLADESRRFTRSIERVDGLDARVKSASEALQSLRSEVEEAREALKALGQSPPPARADQR